MYVAVGFVERRVASRISGNILVVLYSGLFESSLFRRFHYNPFAILISGITNACHSQTIRGFRLFRCSS